VGLLIKAVTFLTCYAKALLVSVLAISRLRESGWSYGSKPEFYPVNPSLTPSRINHRKKDHDGAFNDIDSQSMLSTQNTRNNPRDLALPLQFKFLYFLYPPEILCLERVKDNHPFFKKAN